MRAAARRVCRCRTAGCRAAGRGGGCRPRREYAVRSRAGPRTMSRYSEKSAHRGEENQAPRRCSTPRPARAAAFAPREWATVACAGPWARTTASTALAHSTTVVRPRGSVPRSEPLWLGRSKATTLYPAATSGLMKTPRCARQPPQPCTRYTGGPSPQDSPSIRCPSQVASNGRPDETPGGIRRLEFMSAGWHQARGPMGSHSGREALHTPECPSHLRRNRRFDAGTFDPLRSVRQREPSISSPLHVGRRRA